MEHHRNRWDQWIGGCVLTIGGLWSIAVAVFIVKSLILVGRHPDVVMTAVLLAYPALGVLYLGWALWNQ